MIVSTTNEIAGYRIVRHLGLCRGITVRSRSVVGNWFGGVQAFFGGRLSVFAKLAENARQEAYDLMVQHAQHAGANAVIGMRYDANEIIDGITEVLAYGTAVHGRTAALKPARGAGSRPRRACQGGCRSGRTSAC